MLFIATVLSIKRNGRAFILSPSEGPTAASEQVMNPTLLHWDHGTSEVTRMMTFWLAASVIDCTSDRIAIKRRPAC